MNIPSYLNIDGVYDDTYQQDLNQTLQDNLSDKGWVLPTVTDAQLRTDVVIGPDGVATTLENLMPDGTLWYCSNGAPPCIVAKINGTLRRLDHSAYP